MPSDVKHERADAVVEWCVEAARWHLAKAASLLEETDPQDDRLVPISHMVRCLSQLEPPAS